MYACTLECSVIKHRVKRSAGSLDAKLSGRREREPTDSAPAQATPCLEKRQNAAQSYASNPGKTSSYKCIWSRAQRVNVHTLLRLPLQVSLKLAPIGSTKRMASGASYRPNPPQRPLNLKIPQIINTNTHTMLPISIIKKYQHAPVQCTGSREIRNTSTRIMNTSI